METALKECNFNKAIGPDGFDGLILEKDEVIRRKLIREVVGALNNNSVPDHLKIARLVPLSKNRGSDIAKISEIRPIAVKSHIFKIMERTIQNKIIQTRSTIFDCHKY